jgi:hypothetical protein
MAEMYINVYFRHDDPEMHAKLVRLFEQGNASGDDASRRAFIDIASEINPEQGEGIATAFLNDLRDKILEMFGFEDISDISGFCCASTTCGGGGDRYAARCVKLLYHLCPGIQAQAWGMGDDDPWEFWFKHVDGHLVRHDDEPFDGNDNRIKGTIYRWWHEGLPAAIKEGMLNDADFDEDEDDDNGAPVSDADYVAWLAGQTSSTDLEDDVEEVVMDELVDAFTSALGGLFSGGGTKKPVSTDAFDCETLDEDAVRAVFADMEAHEKDFDVAGIMKHMSRQLRGEVKSSLEGEQTTMPLTYSLYRMSLKLVLKADMEYESDQKIDEIAIENGEARVRTRSDTVCRDPLTQEKMKASTEDTYKLEIVDGKIQITELNSIQTA